MWRRLCQCRFKKRYSRVNVAFLALFFTHLKSRPSRPLKPTPDVWVTWQLNIMVFQKHIHIDLYAAACVFLSKIISGWRGNTSQVRLMLPQTFFTPRVVTYSCHSVAIATKWTVLKAQRLSDSHQCSTVALNVNTSFGTASPTAGRCAGHTYSWPAGCKTICF